VRFQFKNGNVIINHYSADGQKQRTDNYTRLTAITPVGENTVVNPENGYNDAIYSYTGTAYIGSFEYNVSKTKYQGYGGVWYYSDVFNPGKIYTPEGYIDYLSSSIVSNGVRYNYYRKDHLGNIREVWNGVRKNYLGQVKELASTRQRTQYYPSGLPWAYQTGDNAGIQNRKYNGKEWIEMHGYDAYDIVWRQYYPAIGRFQTPDPEIEEAYNESPYAMCDNNMVNRTDPDGRFWNYVAGGIVGGLMEIGTQVVANAVTGGDVTNINWKKVGVSTAEGALTSGGSVALKISATVGAAFAQSALDGNKGLKDIATGTAVNLGAGAIGSGASKLTKGVGEKGLEKVANKMVGSKTAITKSVQNITNTSTKTARGVAKTIQNAEKEAAKEVKKSVQTTTKTVTTGLVNGVYDKNKTNY